MTSKSPSADLPATPSSAANMRTLPINAPKCPVMNFQRDGQMQMNVPVGRASYEPNSLADHGEAAGPRECAVTGFTTAPGRDTNDEEGDKLRVRAELFANHYICRRPFRPLSERPRFQPGRTRRRSRCRPCGLGESGQCSNRMVSSLELPRRSSTLWQSDYPRRAARP